MSAAFRSARRATSARVVRICARVRSRASSRRPHSSRGSAMVCPGMTGTVKWRWRAGPMTMPPEALSPASSAPVPRGPAAGAAGEATAGSSGPSPKLSPARARRAARAGPAWAPQASTTMVWPWQRPSMAMALMLFASTGPRPLERLRTTMWAAGNRPAVCTNRAAGRACSPSRLATTRRAVRTEGSMAGPAGPAGSRSGLSWAVLPASAPRASSSTSSRPPPSRARTAADTAPSTRGAAHRATLARSSGASRSRAISALSTALPRSIRTTTPSPESACRTASATSTGSVPRGRPGRFRPPAAASRTSVPAISRASSSTPSASAALWETMTIPITGRSPRAAQAWPWSAQVSAAVRSSSQAEVAPGS